MSELQMAMFLLAVVISVLAATHPAPPRRRRTRAQRPRDNNPGSHGRRGPALITRRRAPRPTADTTNRNHWDRADLAAGVGRDHADPDLTLTLWPEPR